MSEEMAEKKKREIEIAEADAAEMMKEAETAVCEHCGKLISSFEYLVMLPSFGWVECPGCGGIFCPSYIRKRKLQRIGEANLIKPV
jgi:hypothetical protein